METGKHEDNQILEKSNEEWKKNLPKHFYHIAREKVSERRPGTSSFTLLYVLIPWFLILIKK